MNHTDSLPDGKTPRCESSPETLGDILARHPYLKPTRPTQFAILLVDTPGHPIPAIQRLRAALKLLGRGYHLRCVSAIDAEGTVEVATCA